MEDCRPAAACVRLCKGIPRLFINDRLALPVCYLPSLTSYGAAQDTAEMKRAAAAGIRILVIPWSTEDYADRAHFVNRLKEAMQTSSSMAENPEAYIILRISCNFSPEEAGVDKSQRLVINGGEPWNMLSLSSEAWYRHTVRRLHTVARHIRNDGYLDSRVIGYEILGGDTGEWFGPAYWDGGMDTSEANRLGFQRYIQSRYAADSDLQQAWADETVTLDAVPLPAYDRLPGVTNHKAQREFVRQGQTLFDRPENRRYIDYLDYANEQRADFLAGFAAAVKEGSGGTKLAMTYYGYQADCYTASSHHFALSRLLHQSQFDVFSAPVAYQDRCEGGIGAYMGMADAVTAAGKLWMDEADFRSPCHIDKPPLPYPPTTALLDEMLWREMGKCMIHNTGVWWLSFNQGWYNYPSFWEEHRRLCRLYEAYMGYKTADTPEIAYILDEKAMSLVGDADAVGLKLIRLARSVLYRSGCRFGMYTLADLLEGRVDDAKLYILVNPWRMDESTVRLAAARLHRPGKTTLYMYGSGDTGEEGFLELTGIRLHKRQASEGYTPQWRLQAGLDSAIGDCRYEADELHGITQALADLARTPLNPVYFAENGPSLVSLGTYVGGPADGRTGFALYRQDGWQSLFFGGMKLSAALLRYGVALAGVHRFAPDGDTLDADGQTVMLHVTEPGDKTVYFPTVCDVFDVKNGRWSHGDSFTVKGAYRGRTVLLFYGERKHLQPLADAVMTPDFEQLFKPAVRSLQKKE